MSDRPMPRIGSLCSGVGGLELGLMAVIGGSVAWHVEYDKHPSAVLAARCPGVPNYGDVTTTDWAQVEPIDWLTAGYPCQPFSHAGKRKGSSDERHLWPAVADAIGVLRPGRVLLENVAGHVSLGLDAVLADLAALGYDATWGVVRAADAGACHGRARVFIVAADSIECGWWGSAGFERGLGASQRLATAAAYADGPRRQGSEPAGGRLLSAWGAAPDAAGDGRDEGWPESARIVGRTDAAERRDDTPADADDDPARPRREPGESTRGRAQPAQLRHSPPTDTGGERLHGWPRLEGAWGPAPERGEAGGDAGNSATSWGAYEPAIRRWERVIGRPAPAPTGPGRTGERLSPRFVEWMQGLGAGHVTDILPRNPALKALGNCVVPQQAALAVRTLLNVGSVAA